MPVNSGFPQVDPLGRLKSFEDEIAVDPHAASAERRKAAVGEVQRAEPRVLDCDPFFESAVPQNEWASEAESAQVELTADREIVHTDATPVGRVTLLR